MAEHDHRSDLIESHSVDFVPPNERHGRAADLFTLWFATNIAPLPVVTGALAVQVYGLSLKWGICAILVGHALGAVVLGLCSAQGPLLGVPQMMQSRGQFGRYGAMLVVGFAAVIYVGFFTSNLILAGNSIHEIATSITPRLGAVVAGIGAATIGVIGYKVIHLLNRIGTWVMGTAILIGYVLVINRLPADVASRGGLTAGGWLGTMSLALIWQVSYACYTSDYSRYLPATVGVFRPFLATYLGAFLGTSLSFIFGALVVLAAPEGTAPMAAIHIATGPLGPTLMILLAINVISHNALNLYGATLSILTSIQTFASRWTPGKRSRTVVSAAVLAACLIAAVAAANDFVARFMRFILTMLDVLVPWATINLVDFYLIKRRAYDVPSLFAPDGGRYGLFRPSAILAYVSGIVIQIPFVVLPSYAGVIATALHGVDISWCISPLVTAPVYLWLEQQFASALSPSPAENASR
jgi:NCS1 family nucleobase:cation symporter-1